MAVKNPAGGCIWINAEGRVPFVGKDVKDLENNRYRRKADTYTNVLLRQNSQIGLFSYLNVGCYFQLSYWTQGKAPREKVRMAVEQNML